jgi:hypothetical protein
MKKPYAMIMNRLGPLLPNSHKSGLIRIDIRGEEGLVLDGDGMLTRQGIQIIARDEHTQRPKSIVGSDEKALKKILCQAGAKVDQIIFSMVPASSANTFYSKVPLIWKELEIAALTDIMLTFDHLTRGTNRRFTRSVELTEVRNFIRDAVHSRSISDGEPLNRISLGLQYENMPRYRELRAKVPTEVSPFEHVLLASADVHKRTLDLVWIVLGFDPFGFRVHNWKGDCFTLVFVNPILSNTHPSELIDLPESSLLCKPTNRRAFPDQFTTENAMSTAMADVSQARRIGWMKAVHLVESSADDFVTANIALAGDLATRVTPMHELVLNRLVRMYGRMVSNAAFVEEMRELVDSHLQNGPKEISKEIYTPNADNTDISWSKWLTVYRSSLEETIKHHGMPGDAFEESSGFIREHINANPLGKEPIEGV